MYSTQNTLSVHAHYQMNTHPTASHLCPSMETSEDCLRCWLDGEGRGGGWGEEDHEGSDLGFGDEVDGECMRLIPILET